jgi:hypothetical protein
MYVQPKIRNTIKILLVAQSNTCWCDFALNDHWINSKIRLIPLLNEYWLFLILVGLKNNQK